MSSRYAIQHRALAYQSYIDTTASDTSELELLFMQQVSIQRYRRPICEAMRQLACNFANPFFDCTVGADGDNILESSLGFEGELSSDPSSDREAGAAVASKSASSTSSSRH